MTAQILISELSALVHDSKRKNGELRDAAEKSLRDLKALTNTSEAGLIADLSRRPYFITPFLIACNTRNAKFTGSAITCLQRLVIAKALPKVRIKEVLDSLKECSSLGHDFQLKILQTLPQLLQYYPDETGGDILAESLQLCAILSNSKVAALSGTALATLQQLVITAFERVVEEDKKELQIPAFNEVSYNDGTLTVRNGAYDAYRVLRDLCFISQGGDASFARLDSISKIAGLEIIESVLKNFTRLLSKHQELVQIIRTHVMPLVISSLSAKLSFPLTMRAMRIFTIILQNLVDSLPNECEAGLNSLNHVLDSEAGIAWKRIICLEIMRMVYSDPGLAFKLHAQCDETDGRTHVIRENIAILVKIAAEISVTTSSRSQLVTSASTLVAPKISEASEGSNAALTNLASAGTQSTFARMTCLEQLEKVDQPAVSEDYVYYLILTCMMGLSEGMARFVLPITVISNGKSKRNKARDKITTKDVDNDNQENSTGTQEREPVQSVVSSNRHKAVPLNPLSLKTHKSFHKINTIAVLIDECWPGILATCSTFLNASLNMDNYRALVRSMQKFAQVAGLLRLQTPRDAFLTTLGKSAVPSNVLTATLSSTITSVQDSSGSLPDSKELVTVASPISPNSTAYDKKVRPSLENNMPTLTPRNMLCLRALLNLAIALGPILESAWSIIIEILQQSDIITAALTARTALSNARNLPGTISIDPSAAQALNTEIEAVQAAAYRLFESTVDFPDDAFLDVLRALFSLLHGNFSMTNDGQTNNPRRVGSVSGPASSTKNEIQDYLFALGKIGDVATMNVKRLTESSPKESGWELLKIELTSVTSNAGIAASARHMAAGILTRLLVDMASAATDKAPSRQEATNEQLFDTLRTIITALNLEQQPKTSMDEINHEIHITCLEALKTLLERRGDVLSHNWKLVFAMFSSVFYEPRNLDPVSEDKFSGIISGPNLTIDAISSSACRSAFEAMELLCADFLASVPDGLFATLVDLLTQFTSQKADFNISLTSITYIWKISDLLKRRIDAPTLAQQCEEVLMNPNTRLAIRNAADNNSLSALWMYMLLNLSEVAIDQRAEIRNGAIQTAMRILDNHATLLSPEAWEFGIRSIFLKTVEINHKMQILNRQSIIVNSSVNVEEINETSKMILQGWSRLMSNNMNIITMGKGFEDIWDRIILKLQSFLELCDSEMNTSTYTFLVELLYRSPNPVALKEEWVLLVRDLWTRAIPKRSASFSNDRSEHMSFITYVKLWKTIYRLLKAPHDLSDLHTVTRNLRRCIEETRDVAYTLDVDKMTELQNEVIDCINLMREQKQGNGVIVNLLAHFSTLYLKRAESFNHGEKNTSCVALALVCMDILETEITGSTGQAALLKSGIVSVVLENLAINIEWKYRWSLHGKLCLWRKATLVALSIMKSILPKLDTVLSTTETSIIMWRKIVRIAASIAHAQVEHATIHVSVKDDELFDLEALARLRTLIISRLGSSYIPKDVRRDYAFGLFMNSMVHKSIMDDISESLTEPLHGLYSVRPGITIDSPPSLRMRVSYYCLAELFSLVSSVDDAEERVRLAQATAPFLILRVAHSIKGYLADQPLRGRIPQPWSQRQELIFLLQNLRSLVSENEAIPDTDSVHSDGKKHLFRLFPLLVRAVGVASKDNQLMEEFRQTLEVLEDDLDL